MSKTLITKFFIFGLLFSTSCTTYLIPVGSLKKQFKNIDSTDLREVEMRGPYGEQYFYLANPIDTIKCKDKAGVWYGLINGLSIEIRFTYGVKKRKTVFYFDQIYVDEYSVTGVQSRLLPDIRKTIPLDSINKIEVQDGRKKFSYVKP